MDLHHQAKIKELAEQHGPEKVMVVLGSPDPESASLSAETVISGDPTYAGPLAEVQLGLDVYHVLEEPIKTAIPEEIWEQQIGVMADVLDAEGIAKALNDLRSKGGK